MMQPLSAGPKRTRKIPIHERACTVGNIVSINAYRANKALLKQRLIEGGYQLSETPHFLLARRAVAPTTIVAHWFAPHDIDADIGYYFMQELKPLGIIEGAEDFANLFGAVVCSLFPHDAQKALYLYGQNTLQRYDRLLTSGSSHTVQGSPIDIFSRLYRRVCALQIGTSFLDAGCSFGFLPLLMAKRFPSLKLAAGIDIQSESFAIVRAIAEDQQLHNVHFAQVDLLDDEVWQPGDFDTVTLLHVLEHFTGEEMYHALTNLLKITKQRLIIAVPYEHETPEDAYGHRQLFSRAKLEAVGQWCLQQWGEGAVYYEDSADGLLLLDRSFQ